jgi:uncharacterized protein (TIGR03085 family)
MTYSRDERRALCALLDETGPGAPTLCDGWTTLDLAAHLVLREHHPAAGAGIMIRPLAGYTSRVQRRLAEQTPFPRLVEIIRIGPPRLSLFGIPGMDDRGNTTEYFVHHEDVRRGAPGWEPRKLDAGLADLLWRRLRSAKFLLRKAPVGVELARDDADLPQSPAGDTQHLLGTAPQTPMAQRPPRTRMTIKAGAPMVTVTGSPGELTMWAAGRTAAARVRLDGDEVSVRKLTQARWGL